MYFKNKKFVQRTDFFSNLIEVFKISKILLLKKMLIDILKGAVHLKHRPTMFKWKVAPQLGLKERCILKPITRTN
jgi:hypothetical protein